jgi:uncharacterized 2Fe-2S/4Fe-4S cluster protein (DUF4445 family)
VTCAVEFEPMGCRVPCAGGATLLEVARSAGIFLTSVCGGQGSCGRCKVRIVAGSLPAPNGYERSRLGSDEIAAGFRLACAVRVVQDLKVAVPAASLAHAPRVQLSGEGVDLAVDPIVSAYDLVVPESSPEVPANGWDVLQKGLREPHGRENLRVDAALIQVLPSVLRAGRPRVTALVRDDEVIGVLPQGQEPLGMAFDLGTTTVAAWLVNLRTGVLLATRGMLNPQVAYGEDVISRIRCAMERGGEALQRSILEALNRLIEQMAGSSEEVVEVVVAGNTAMHHLVLGLPVKQLGTAPYRPAVCEPIDIKARDLGLRAARGAYVHCMPPIAGFVGGDHVAMLLATGMWETEKCVIGVDIGTNTEVTLAARGILTSVSCASGPAFEGAGVSRGMRADDGAIEKVRIDDQGIHLKVIGDVRPTGICGSGIVDLLGELRRRQVITPRGALRHHPLVRPGASGPEFVLAPGGTTGTGEDIVVTQRDIGEIQLAKAAVRAGIGILLDQAGIGEHEIDEMVIAGGFGSGIDPQSAVGIGMFPPLPPGRFRQVGNAAGAGARLVLVSKRGRAIAKEIARRVRYVELATHPGFSRAFSHGLRFP